MPETGVAGGAEPAAGQAAATADEAAGSAPPARHRGWFVLGIVLQIVAWTLIWLGIAIAIGVGGQLTEFRYVGF